MRLKQIKLAGFKSFVDPTKIPFLKPLTGIIGPNGCGKSNTIDAVRWVLGESSAKHLRGDAMTDVIFNGSSARKPVSVASVELVFENLDGRLGGQYASYQEISVKRQVNRDAESAYFLNGQKCRRKDITDLFMGTGLGPRSYAIIEQGTISRLIESKPQELRVFIEEAAGISRYKERRRDTENRIRHTRENLERLGDIRQELGKQLEKLATQSRAAQRYREYKQQERETQAQLLVMRYQELMGKAESLSADINLKLLEQEKLLAAKAAVETEATTQRLKVEALERQEQALVQSYFQVGTQVARLEQQLAHEEQQDAGFQQSLEKIRQQRQMLHEQLATLTGQVTGLDEQLAPVSDEKTLLEETIEELSERLMVLDEDKEQLDIRLQAARQQQSEQQLKLAGVQGQCNQTTQLLTMKMEQLAEISAGQLSAGEEGDLTSLALELEQLTVNRQQAFDELEALKVRQSQLQQQRQHQEAELHGMHQSLSGYESRRDVIAQWLDKAKSSQNEQQLWQVLEVKPGWEDAVSLLLQGLLDQPVTTAFSANGWQRQGEVTSCEGFSAPVNLAPWLQGVSWLSSLDEARARQAALQSHERIVTADGYLVGKGFLLAGGSSADSAIALQNELQSVQQAIEPLLKASGELTLSVRQLTEQAELLALRLDEARLKLEDCTVAQARASQQLQHEQERMIRAREQAKAAEQKTLKLRQEIELLSGQRAELELQLAQLDEDQPNASEEIEALTERQTQAGLQVRDFRAQLSAKQQVLQQLERRSNESQTQLALTRLQIQQVQMRLGELEQAEAELHSQRRQHDPQGAGQLDGVNRELQTQMAKHSELQAQVEQIRAEQVHWQELLDASLLMQKQEVGKIEAVSQVIAELKLKREGIKGQADSQMRLLIEAEIRLDEVGGSLPEGANAECWQETLDSLRAKISRLGPINLAAIEEYDQQSERKQYLDDQNDDLSRALESLEEAIRKIDRETRSRFKATFEQINNDLGSLFPKVFGGGSAYLALTDDDLLETGVTIMARPPGKKNSTIHLLSGGEKALTALSLVFAIFRLNPAPFCMLDEVDAPLDDANVERFCRLLREMSQSVQFIYISHNKITMEMADQLIGVTMHEPGVSRIVAVDLEEAVAMADAG
ncbi:chromosome segregation protein SMC [Shewanella sp. GXUN23E]|uniref:chromosome segregation protein SMC n=1 Tax=Shewanella sp. GXUN23E TaxID=3422498 RepID=UPI003D7EAA1D